MTMVGAEPSWIDLEGAVNVRDVGGLPLIDGGTVVAGRLLRSDNLQDLSAADIEELVGAHGLRAVVDLRTEIEVDGEGPGPLMADDRVIVEHRSLYPESGGKTDLDVETIRPWQQGARGRDFPDEPAAVQAYMGYLAHRPDSIVAALRTIAEPPGGTGAVLVHCAAGKDRTGLVVALALEIAGVRREAIVADYVATAQRIEAIVTRLLASPVYANEMGQFSTADHAPHPETMERLLELIDERLGGAATWLAEHGVDDSAQATLRDRLIRP